MGKNGEGFCELRHFLMLFGMRVIRINTLLCVIIVFTVLLFFITLFQLRDVSTGDYTFTGYSGHSLRGTAKLKSSCPKAYLKLDRSHRTDCVDDFTFEVFMIWTTGPETFSIRNQWSIESFFKHNPCARVRVYANELPTDFFSTFSMLHYDIEVTSFNLVSNSLGLKDDDVGFRWLKAISRWKKTSPYYHVHCSDILRLLLLYRYGGSYIDFDHIHTRPINSLGRRNVVGAEVCQDDNPDCLTVDMLLKLERTVWRGNELA